MQNPIHPNITVRSASLDDLPKLVSIMDDLGYPTTIQDLTVRFDAIWRHPDYAIFLAVSGFEVCGLIGLINELAFEHNETYVRIGALVVSRHYRNQGIGRILIQEAERWASTRRAHYLLVNSGIRPERDVAHRFYVALGFDARSRGFKKSIPLTK